MLQITKRWVSDTLYQEITNPVLPTMIPRPKISPKQMIAFDWFIDVCEQNDFLCKLYTYKDIEIGIRPAFKIRAVKKAKKSDSQPSIQQAIWGSRDEGFSPPYFFGENCKTDEDVLFWERCIFDYYYGTPPSGADRKVSQFDFVAILHAIPLNEAEVTMLEGGGHEVYGEPTTTLINQESADTVTFSKAQKTLEKIEKLEKTLGELQPYSVFDFPEG